MLTKAIPLEIVDLKEAPSGERTFTAYASTFGNTDHGGDVIEKGAFAKSLKARSFRPLLWQHQQFSPIGIEKSLREDNKGLLGTWQLLMGGPADYAYECLKAGAVRAMSIGYMPDQFTYDDGGDVRILKAVDLLENSVVSLPMNEQAQVTGVKSRFCPDCGTAIEAKATWDTAYVNALPDSAFALVYTDADGNKQRKLPHHDAEGKLDSAHLNNAMSRCPQMTGVTDAQRAKAQAHLDSHKGKTDDVYDVDDDHSHSGLILPDLDLDTSFEDLISQVSKYVTVGVDEAEALQARRQSDQRELSEAHIAALSAFEAQLKDYLPRLGVILRAPTPVTPPVAPVKADSNGSADGLALRLELARRRLRRAGVQV